MLKLVCIAIYMVITIQPLRATVLRLGLVVRDG